MGQRARGLRLVLMGGGAALAVASPLAFALGSAELGDTVSASIIAATAVVAAAVPLWPSPPDEPEPDTRDDLAGVAAVRTGRAAASGGGDANSGVRVTGGVRGRLLAIGTGRATARGRGSSANSGVEIRASSRTDSRVGSGEDEA